MLPRSQEAYEAVRRGHRRVAHADLYYPSGFQTELPIKAGTVDFTLSDDEGQRKGRITVPGYEWFDILEPGHYGWVVVRIDLDGIQEFNLGEFPIVDVQVERPGGEVEVALGDWSYRRSQPMPEAQTPIGSTSQTVRAVCQEYLGHVMPTGASFTITRDDSGGALCQSPKDVSLGSGDVWSALTALCNQVGCILMVTSRSTGEIRRYDPNAAAADDVTGTVITEHLGIMASKAVNNVIVQLESSDPAAPEGTMFRRDLPLTTGPYRYDQAGLGELTHSQVIRQMVATQAAANAEAQRIYDRVVGIVRTHSLSVVPQPWLQIGDLISWTPTTMSTSITGMVNSLTFPLTGGGATQGQSLRMRDALIR